MPEVDEKEPTIRVQIKYPDNKRQVGWLGIRFQIFSNAWDEIGGKV